MMPVCSGLAVGISILAICFSAHWNKQIARTLQGTTASLENVGKSLEETGKSSSEIADTLGVLHPILDRTGDSSHTMGQMLESLAAIMKDVCVQSKEIVKALQDYARPAVSIVDFRWDIEDDRPVGVQFTLENLSNVPVTVCSARFETVCSQQPIDRQIVEYLTGRPFVGRGRTLQYRSHSPRLYSEHLTGASYLTVKFQATVSRAGDSVQYVYDTTRTVRFPGSDSCVLSETISSPKSHTRVFLDEQLGLDGQGL
jgi:hypothetical protein